MHWIRGSFVSVTLFIAAAAAVQAQPNFGRAVVVGEGEVIVGEPAQGNAFRPGTVYVYRKTGGIWREAAKLVAPESQRADGFGASVVLSGNTLFVGQENTIHVFRKDARGAWQPAGSVPAPSTLQPNERYGAAIASSGDWLLVGAPGQAPGGGRRGGGGGGRAGGAEPPPPPAGAVYVFRRGANGEWTQSGKIAAADATTGDQFGSAIAVAEARALIGAPARNQRAGAVYAFRFDPTTGGWVETSRVDAPGGAPQGGRRGGGGAQAQSATPVAQPPAEQFGSTIFVQNDRAYIGAPGSSDNYGAVFVYRRNATTGDWTQQSRLVAFSGGRQESFGQSVAADGNDVFVGAPARPEQVGGANRRTGGVFVFQTRDSVATAVAARFVRPTKFDWDDQIGTGVSVRGGVAAIASAGADHSAGIVTVFERAANGDWRESAKLASPADAMQALTGRERKCSAEGKVGVFSCGDAELQSYLPVSKIAINPRGVRLNDMWGWSDTQTNREYALVGRIEGTAFVDVTDPANPIFVGELPKTPGVPDGTWRDIKVYKDHAYIVADGSGAHGMQVFDLRQLRGLKGTPPVSFKPTAHYTRINSSHNIVINEESGFAYAVGASAGGETCGGGLHMIDIKDPKNPTFAGCFADPLTGRASTGYSHDAQCVTYKGPDAQYRGREICLGSNENSLSIADVTDKANPKAISRAAYPNPAYTHQGWFTEDQRYFFMDDEGDELAGTVQRTRTLVWDLSDLDDPKLAHEFMGTSGASDHNLYIKGNLMYQSNYRAGLRIIDIADPLKPVEVGFFDTAPYLADAPGFSGTWSNYPFFKSGAIGVSSVHEGLFLVKKRTPVL